MREIEKERQTERERKRECAGKEKGGLESLTKAGWWWGGGGLLTAREKDCRPGQLSMSKRFLLWPVKTMRATAVSLTA